MGINTCSLCLDKQRKIDQLEDEVGRLKQPLGTLRKRENLVELKDYCTITTDCLLVLLAQKTDAVLKDRYVYIDNGSPVLAVAHADVYWRIEGLLSFTQGNIQIGPGYTGLFAVSG